MSNQFDTVMPVEEIDWNRCMIAPETSIIDGFYWRVPVWSPEAIQRNALPLLPHDGLLIAAAPGWSYFNLLEYAGNKEWTYSFRPPVGTVWIYGDYDREAQAASREGIPCSSKGPDVHVLSQTFFAGFEPWMEAREAVSPSSFTEIYGNADPMKIGEAWKVALSIITGIEAGEFQSTPRGRLEWASGLKTMTRGAESPFEEVLLAEPPRRSNNYDVSLTSFLPSS